MRDGRRCRRAAAHDRDADHLAPVADRQVHVLARRVAKVGHDRQGGGPEFARLLGELPELEQPKPEMDHASRRARDISGARASDRVARRWTSAGRRAARARRCPARGRPGRRPRGSRSCGRGRRTRRLAAASGIGQATCSASRCVSASAACRTSGTIRFGSMSATGPATEIAATGQRSGDRIGLATPTTPGNVSQRSMATDCCAHAGELPLEHAARLGVEVRHDAAQDRLVVGERQHRLAEGGRHRGHSNSRP